LLHLELESAVRWWPFRLIRSIAFIGFILER
jgi:hypothetical protein